MKEIVGIFSIFSLCQYIVFKKILEAQKKKISYLQYSNDLLASSNIKLRKENEKLLWQLFNNQVNYEADKETDTDTEEDEDLIKIKKL